MATFEFLRLSLSVPRIGPLDSSPSEPSEARQDYLRYLFGEPHTFSFRRSLFSFVPASTNALKSHVLAGFIGKQTERMKMQGPEQLFALAPAKEWNAAFLVVDTRPDQQVVAIERRNNVGTSHNVLEHFIESRLSAYRRTAWHVDVEYISRIEDFFAIAKHHYGKLTQLSFTFHPANGLKGWDKFKKLDKLGKDQTNADESEYSLKNHDGALNPQGEFVEKALEYAGEGAGVTKLKVGRRVVYDSRQHKETIEVAEDMMPREGEQIKVAGTADFLLTARAKNSVHEKEK